MLKPLHENVILIKEEAEKKTASGIILTDNSEKKSNIAAVVAVGEDVESEIKVNDRVVYKEYSGTNVEMDDKKYIIIEAEDILAIVE
ncbi:MAG: co-chaperone GroES [Erysipelotrichaceae bacterium]|jgi:chaperonin GroES|nr:co-chaperone GroES [Erysipelotrichaceae bacterium]